MAMIRLIMLGLVLSGCGMLPGAVVSGPLPDLPGCDQTDDFSFVGEATLDALDLGVGLEGSRVGTVWVTAGKVQFDEPRPAGAPVPVQEPSRMVCVQWPDGSGMSGPVAEDWQPPAAMVTGGGAVPLAPILVVVVLAVLGAASFFAFRRERPSDV